MRPNEIELRGRIEFGSIEKMAATPGQESKHPRWERVVRRGPWKRRAKCVGRWRPGSRSLFYLVPLIYYSSLQEPVRTGMDDVNGDRQNTKAREEW